MQRWRKYLYLGIIGMLTTTTISATYWQGSRYLQSKKRWKIISQQLSNENPPDIASVSDFHPFQYLTVNAKMPSQYVLVSRTRQSRVGYLVVKPIFYNKDGKRKCIIGVEGWIPEDFDYKTKENQYKIKGILREKEKKDYLHTKMKEQDLQKFKMNTYINIEKVRKDLNLAEDEIQTNFYFQILKDLHDNQNHYPYQYSVDNFQLPYLTPDKHRAYATFWGLTTMVGLTAMFKVLKMK